MELMGIRYSRGVQARAHDRGSVFKQNARRDYFYSNVIQDAILNGAR